MSLVQTVLLFAGINAAVLVAQALCLILILRWFEEVRYLVPKAIVVCLICGVIGLGLNIADNVINLQAAARDVAGTGGISQQLAGSFRLAVFLSQLCLAWLAVKLVCRTAWIPALLGAMTVQLTGLAVNLPVKSLETRLVGTFHIPIDSMAPGLCGVHAQLECPACGFPYAFSMADRLQPSRKALPSKTTVCPNCGKDWQVSTSANLRDGDWIVTTHTRPTRRWDLIVYQHQPRGENARPLTYVERLVGLPNETLELTGGDVFVAGQCLHKLPNEREDMWLGVHDTKYAPAAALPDTPHWTATEIASHWHEGEGGRWTYQGENVGPDTLLFAGQLVDLLRYNDRDATWAPEQDASAPFTGDVRVTCDLTQFSGNGNFGFEWNFRGVQIVALVSGSGMVEIIAMDRLVADQRGGESGRTSVRGNIVGVLDTRQQISFAFRDGMAYVLQGNAIIARLPAGAQDLDTAKRRLIGYNGPCRLALSAARCNLSFARIVVSRDVYFRSAEELPLAINGPAYGCRNHPIALDGDSFYVLGDNSLRAIDSRHFGQVAEKDVVGLARWLFWPRQRARSLR